MSKRTLAPAGILVMVGSLVLSGCGSRDSGNAGSGDDASGGTKTAKIGVIAPLSGDLSAMGLGIQHSVELAVKQANESNAIPGWKLEVSAKDDEAKPDPGRNGATALAGDKDVIGVVGTLNTSVSQGVQPVLSAANIVQVSPANTGPALTRGADPVNSPKRLYKTYFRTCTTDLVQGPFAARYLYNTAKITKVATIHDNKAYGKGLVDAFTTEFKKLGGTVTKASTINPDDSNFQAAISTVKAGAPQAVYYGGEYPQAGPLSNQMKSAGLNIPLMGGDGLFDDRFVKLAGAKATGDMATSVGAPTESLEQGKKFLADYKAAGYAEGASAYGAYAYDAANSIINALKTSLKDATDVESARQATVDAMSSVDFAGVTGQVAFDEYGDSKTRVLTVYKVTGGKWAPAKTEEFK